MRWINVKLTDISNPKQWKNLPVSELTEKGYPVYGANGVIGRYREYNHEFPTLAITCRGATCGTLNITEPKSYITSNAMALDDLKEGIDLHFLFYTLKRRGFKDVISGSAQPQITRDSLNKIEVSIPERIEDQLHIVNILKKAEALIVQRKSSIQLLDELLKSTFLEMFGDPVKNDKGWKLVPLNSFGRIITGNTPPRNDKSNFSTQFIEWVKTDNILEEDVFVTTAVEYLSEIGSIKARIVSEGALLVACIAGSANSIGRAALANRKLAFNQQINAIQPNNDILPFYLYWLFKICKLYIQSRATKGMKKILTKGDFEKIVMIKPPYSLQLQFAQIVEKVEAQKAFYQQSLQELEQLYGALSQKAFRGELIPAGVREAVAG